MGKRGPKPKGKVKIKWSSNFAYAVGLLVSDGCLSPSGRHIIFVSKDVEQLENFNRALGVSIRQTSHWRNAARIQFGDVEFYNFLISIGLMPNKSKIIGEIKIPSRYFFDFLRGSFDGDGCTYSYWDPRWRSSFMFYTTFVSASKKHIDWLRGEIFDRLGIRGHVTGAGKHGTAYQLKYAKADSLRLLRKMYHSADVVCLTRKRLKIQGMLNIIGQQLNLLKKD